MRVSRAQAAENRERILDVAARLFRERGIDGIGVADLMQGAGLTHGQARLDGTDERIIAFLGERTHQTCPIGLIAMARYLLTCPDRTDELAALTRPPAAADPAPRAALPVMVIYGENDDAWPPAAQHRMARRLHAERACIPGAAHSPAVEAPDTTARALTTFWNAAERRRPVSHPPK